MVLQYKSLDSQEAKESSGVRFTALCCIVFKLQDCENSAEFPAELPESGCKANDLMTFIQFSEYIYTLICSLANNFIASIGKYPT